MRRTGNCSSPPAIGMYVSTTSKGMRIFMELSTALVRVATPPAASTAAACSSSRRLFVRMLPPRKNDSIWQRRARRRSRFLLACRQVRRHRGVKRSIILLVLVAIAQRKLARFAIRQRNARSAPCLGVGELVMFIAIDRARLAVRIPRARNAVASARCERGLQLLLRFAIVRSRAVEPQ